MLLDHQHILTSTVTSQTTQNEKFKLHFFFQNNYIPLDMLSYVQLIDQNTE